MRVSIVVAVGATGEKEDLEKFMDLCAADFEVRSQQIAVELMGGRVTILPMSEAMEDDEISESAGPSS